MRRSEDHVRCPAVGRGTTQQASDFCAQEPIRNPATCCNGEPTGCKAGNAERWPSGRRRTPGTRVGGNPSPGFESLSLRQFPLSQSIEDPKWGSFFRIQMGLDRVRLVLKQMVGENHERANLESTFRFNSIQTFQYGYRPSEIGRMPKADL